MTQTPTPKAPTFLQLFKRDQKGTIAVMAALCAIPIFLAAGTAIDFVRLNAAQTQVQAVLDVAALAGASLKNKSDTQRIAAAEMSFATNMAQGAAAGLAPVASFTIVNGKVVATADLELPTSFMALAGLDVMNGHSESEVGILADKNAEIALVLDYSGSMGDPVGGKVKYIAMRDAVTTLVNDLNSTDPGKVKFGLVPFSHNVYTSMASKYVLGAAGTTWTGCTQDRQYPFNLKDSTPTAATETKWNQPVAPDHAAWGCNGYKLNNLKTVDLTANAKSLTDQLAVMKPYAWTHIAVGVEFGYQLLSPNAPFTSGVEYSDTTTKKFMVVLTDGMQTEPAFGPSGSRTVANGESNLEQLCSNAKADGITIITMAFDLDDTTTRKRLQNCATDPAKDFMVADSSADLASAFETVKAAITAEIFLEK